MSIRYRFTAHRKGGSFRHLRSFAGAIRQSIGIQIYICTCTYTHTYIPSFILFAVHESVIIRKLVGKSALNQTVIGGKKGYAPLGLLIRADDFNVIYYISSKYVRRGRRSLFLFLSRH